MLTETISCDYDITKNTCTFSCGQAEEWKCRARHDYYMRENSFERDIHNLKKELSEKYKEIALINFLNAESTALATETESLQNLKISLVSFKDTALALQKAFNEDENKYLLNLKGIFSCKEERIKEIEILIEHQENFINKLDFFLEKKKALLQEFLASIKETAPQIKESENN